MSDMWGKKKTAHSVLLVVHSNAPVARVAMHPPRC